MKRDEVIEIEQDEALSSVEAVNGDIIHCFMGFVGADWDKSNVIDLIKSSQCIAWADNLFGHNLAVIAAGRLHSFDIQYVPESLPAQKGEV